LAKDVPETSLALVVTVLDQNQFDVGWNPNWAHTTPMGRPAWVINANHVSYMLFLCFFDVVRLTWWTSFLDKKVLDGGK